MNNRYINRAFSDLQKVLQNNVIRGKVLAKETSMRVGGPGEIFAVVDSIEHLDATINISKDWGLPVFVIGRGSNLLVSDSGFPGVIMRLGRDFMQKKIKDTRIQAGAAITLPSLVQVALKNSLSGLSFAVGIPGSLGGGLIMNAGAHGNCLGDIVRNVVVYTKDCELKVLGRSKLEFKYRKGHFHENDIIVEATLDLVPGDIDLIKQQMEDFFTERKNSQPLQFPSAGSVFKNPEDVPAWMLIEKAGCKEMRVGDAEISIKHANFIINRGHATASDVYDLLRLVQKRVFDYHGIILEPEIQFLGEFDEVLMIPGRN